MHELIKMNEIWCDFFSNLCPSLDVNSENFHILNLQNKSEFFSTWLAWRMKSYKCPADTFYGLAWKNLLCVKVQGMSGEIDIRGDRGVFTLSTQHQ